MGYGVVWVTMRGMGYEGSDCSGFFMTEDILAYIHQ